MDNQIKAAHIQGRATVIAAIISGIVGAISIVVNICGYNYMNGLLESIDTLTAEKSDLSIQIIELNSELSQSQTSHADLLEQYEIRTNELNQSKQDYADLYRKYQSIVNPTDPPIPSVSNTTITKTTWIDQLDIFYQEGKHISGSDSDGWCKIWDSTLKKDSLGNEHNHGIYVRSYREDTYIIEYILDDVYTGFKGLFTLEYESRNTTIENNLKVYSINDGNEKELIYSTPQPLSGGTKPIEFDFPINGTDHIRIEISSGSGDQGEFFLALVDACFYK